MDFVKKNCRHEWFLNSYHPRHRNKAAEDRKFAAKSSAEAFAKKTSEDGMKAFLLTVIF
jgi:hypothetical protein